jgi:hypothetical protein
LEEGEATDAHGIDWTQGVLRNDRTPLNTPYTPQLVKLHMKRHDEYENQADADRAEGLLTRVAASVRAKMAVLARPVRKIRCVVDTASETLRTASTNR